MKILSWNVNGIRAVHRKEEFYKFIQENDPDVFCLQETKAHAFQLEDDIRNVPGFTSYFNEAEKKGYSGTAIYTKIAPLTVTNDIGIIEHDLEGRVVTMEFEKYFLVNVYVPNAKSDLARLEYRQRWDADFLKYLKSIEKVKPVIVCGDLNVAHKEIDLARPDTNHNSAGFTDEERQGMTNYIDAGFVDTFRVFEQGPDHYTWWSFRGGARKRNVGWRIDYFLVSESLKDKLQEAFILPEQMGSDHCPVGICLQ